MRQDQIQSPSAREGKMYCCLTVLYGVVFIPFVYENISKYFVQWLSENKIHWVYSNVSVNLSDSQAVFHETLNSWEESGVCWGGRHVRLCLSYFR